MLKFLRWHSQEPNKQEIKNTKYGVHSRFFVTSACFNKTYSSVNPDRVSNPVRVVLLQLHERLQKIGNAPEIRNKSE
ncbi:MAG: hypothetical protein CV080_06260 [Candidatus Kuenenia stuttgartiensis]|nr:MAG: hypothetical protein CV080_06260 [Candidatus Kuenenia stuttgartiensis]